MKARTLLRLLWLVVGIVALGASGPAWAEEARPSVLVVLVDPGSTGLEPADVRAAIARELNLDVVDAPVAGAGGTMTVKIDGATELSMTFQSADGWVDVTRSVELPAEPAEQTETIALLAGNLARNEAGELLAGLKPKANPPAQPPRPPPALPPKPAPPPNPAAPAKLRGCAGDHPSRLVNLSLWHPLALERDSERHAYHIELGLGHSRVGGVSGFGLSSLSMKTEGPVLGAVVTGLYLDAGGPDCGALMSGVGIRARGSLDGVEAGGLFLWRDGKLTGVQAAGALTTARGVAGAQMAGLLALDLGDLAGVQLGTVSIATGRLAGVQLSGLGNFAGGSAGGVQLAGVYNHSGDFDGIQIGLVNYANHVRGVQLGVINVSRKVDGIALGLVNVVRQGRTQLVAWGDGPARANLGVKYLFQPVYTLLGVGYDFEQPATSASSAIGVHVPVGRFFGDLDGMYSFVGDWWLRGIQEFHARHEFRYRALVGVELVPRGFGVFAGGAVEHGVDSAGRQLHWRPEALAGVQVF